MANNEIAFLTVTEAARILRVHPQTMQNWCKMDRYGAILRPVTVGGDSPHLIIPRANFEQFQAEVWPAIQARWARRGKQGPA